MRKVWLFVFLAFGEHIAFSKLRNVGRDRAREKRKKNRPKVYHVID